MYPEEDFAELLSQHGRPAESASATTATAPDHAHAAPAATGHAVGAAVHAGGANGAAAATATVVGGSGTSVRYVSTRGGEGAGAPPSISFTDAVFAGVAPDGGLYVPTEVPTLPAGQLAAWAADLTAGYVDVAFGVMRLFVRDDEIPAGDLRALLAKSYASSGEGGVWDTPAIAPLVSLPIAGGGSGSGNASALSSPPLWLLEQFHGPTAAFKDHALQLLGNLFEYLLARRQRAGEGIGVHAIARMTVLGATSGDTGSAAIAGLRGKAGVDVVILHPEGRVAPVQEMQARARRRAGRGAGVKQRL